MTKPAQLFFLILLGAAGCARKPSEPAEAPTPPPSAASSSPVRASYGGGVASSPVPPESHPVAPEHAAPADDPECVPAEWKSSVIAEQSGWPSAGVSYPSGWDLVPQAPGRIQLGVRDQPFQLIVSVLRVATMNEGEVRLLDERTLGKYQVISPWQQVDQIANAGVYKITRKTAATTLLTRYYSGHEGLIMMTFETGGPIEHCIYEQYKSIVRRLKPQFLP